MTELLERQFGVDDIAADGRTVVGTVVPFNTPTDVVDVIDGEPVEYREAFAPGAFDRAVQTPDRVALTYLHRVGFEDLVGRGVQFTDDGARLRGTFRLFEERASMTREVIESGLAARMSVGFHDVASPVLTDGVVVRQAVHLGHVGLVPQGAYDDAQVEQVRTARELLEDTPNADLVRQVLAELAPTSDDPPTELLDTVHRPNADAVRGILEGLRGGE